MYIVNQGDRKIDLTEARRLRNSRTHETSNAAVCCWLRISKQVSTPVDRASLRSLFTRSAGTQERNYWIQSNLPRFDRLVQDLSIPLPSYHSPRSSSFSTPRQYDARLESITIASNQQRQLAPLDWRAKLFTQKQECSLWKSDVPRRIRPWPIHPLAENTQGRVETTNGEVRMKAVRSKTLRERVRLIREDWKIPWKLAQN